MASQFDVTGKRILVMGAARSGMAAARLLAGRGALVTLNDIKPVQELSAALESLDGVPVELRLGEGPDKLLPESDLVVVSPGIPLNQAFLDQCAALSVPIIGELALAASLTDLPILAVTGTNGKTTTVSLLGEMFMQAGRVVHVAGNVGYPLSAAVLTAGPEDVLVAEVSSFQLETAPHFHPRAAAVLNITPDHLNRHGSMENYIALKARIFENQMPADLAVLNLDDPLTRFMADGVQAQLAYFTVEQEVEAGAMLRGDELILRRDGQERVISHIRDLKLSGAHNVQNALAALIMADFMGVPPQVSAYGLKVFQGVEHRIEFVRELGGVTYYNDSKGTNPDATITAFKAMRAPTVVILGGYDKKTSFAQMALMARTNPYIKKAVLTGQTAGQIASALEEAGFTAYRHAGNLEEAVNLAESLAESGGNVLFSPACASFDQFKDYEERGRIFKQLVMSLGVPGG
ncbi:MAG: UDP-N-acetylmuramoyl-L-alanine--D-glutamate ligase [Eubacteriales bacterium]|nr:UDP-N-acetylmuramoyl-L-alanine--D-glutamate ligase [Eubacteriales bacterium]